MLAYCKCSRLWAELEESWELSVGYPLVSEQRSERLLIHAANRRGATEGGIRWCCRRRAAAAEGQDNGCLVDNEHCSDRLAHSATAPLGGGLAEAPLGSSRKGEPGCRTPCSKLPIEKGGNCRAPCWEGTRSLGWQNAGVETENLWVVVVQTTMADGHQEGQKHGTSRQAGNNLGQYCGRPPAQARGATPIGNGVDLSQTGYGMCTMCAIGCRTVCLLLAKQRRH